MRHVHDTATLCASRVRGIAASPCDMAHSTRGLVGSGERAWPSQLARDEPVGRQGTADYQNNGGYSVTLVIPATALPPQRWLAQELVFALHGFSVGREKPTVSSPQLALELPYEHHGQFPRPASLFGVRQAERHW